jgi:hypothetical protein
MVLFLYAPLCAVTGLTACQVLGKGCRYRVFLGWLATVGLIALGNALFCVAA